MKCGEETINKYADGELGPEEKIEFERHLEVCGDCRKKSLALAKALAVLRTAQSAPELPPVSLWPRIRKKTLRRMPARLYGVCAAAAAALVMVSFFSAGNPAESSVLEYAAAQLEYIHGENGYATDSDINGDTVIEMFLRGEL